MYIINILKYIPENPNSGYYDADIEHDGNVEPFGSYIESIKENAYVCKNFKDARIASEEKRKMAELQLENQELIHKNQEMALDFEAKIKEMALKYNTQLDTAKIKADADLDKMMMATDTKILEQAQKSANMFSKQVQGLDENQRPGEQVGGDQPIQPSQTDTRE